MAVRGDVSWTPLVRDADVLLVVPPFAEPLWPALGVHLLQASARRAGFEVSVLYANLLFAREIGLDRYVAISRAPIDLVAGERLFARAAFGLDPLGDRGATIGNGREWTGVVPGEAPSAFLELQQLLALEAHAPSWAERLGAEIAARSFAIVGATTTFEQTAASVALLRRIKDLRPDTIAILGGANCEGAMAPGIAGLDPAIDYVFSGESEATFPSWLHAWRGGVPPNGRIVRGQPCTRLDDLPTPDYAEYFAQRDAFLPHASADAESTWLSYETSRGCWWGQKHHCTFCGLNGEGIGFRQKSPDRVMAELRALVEAHRVRAVWMADNIMPHAYFRTLLPRLERELPGLSIFYEQKANLSLSKVEALARAGIRSMQPGIEALSSDLLTLMDKGVTADQNVALLRYARSVGIYLLWNLLWGLPGDRDEWYEQTLELLPALHHLQPPSGLLHLSVDRFSPYFERAEALGMRDVRPLPAYGAAFPPAADAVSLAYHFTADYDCASHRNPTLIARIRDALGAWWRRWERGPESAPLLRVSVLSSSYYVLTDTRGLPGTEATEILEPEQAMWALAAPRDADTADVTCALERKLGVMLEGRYVPLATATPDLLREAERWAGRQGRVEAASEVE